MGKRSRRGSDSDSSDSDNDRHDHSSKRERRSSKADKHSQGKHSGRPTRVEEIGMSADVDDSRAKKSEFAHWLQHDRSKPKDIAKLDTAHEKRYFKKFVKRWNRGKLDIAYYDGRFGSAFKVTSIERVPAARDDVELGPRRPTADDLALQHDAELDHRAAQRDAERISAKRDKREARQEERDNQATGRDRVQEKRAELRESNRAMAATREQGDMEVSEDTLMGGSTSSFAEAIRRRDVARAKYQAKTADKRAAMDERVSNMRQKEDSTMAMFKAMAAARYGS